MESSGGAEQPAAALPAAKRRSGGQRPGGRWVAFLALLVALTSLGLGGWQYYLSLQVQSEKNALRAQIDGAMAQLQSTQAASLQELRDRQQELVEQLAQTGQETRARDEQLQTRLQALRRQLVELGAADRSKWMLAEVEYLLRLADQRLLMAADLHSAIALVSSADDVLRQLDQPRLHPVRLAIAEDLAALRGLAPVDIEGIWLRLQALAGQVDNLALFELPAAAAETPQADADGGQQPLTEGLRAALSKLSGYVVVRRREAPYAALMDPQWENLVRHNLRLLLEQSRAALLAREQSLYRQSIASARHWLAEFFSLNETGVAALDAELATLEALPIKPDFPDISRSLAALRTAVDATGQVEPRP